MHASRRLMRLLVLLASVAPVVAVASIEVHGTVTTAQGQPLSGATVRVFTEQCFIGCTYSQVGAGITGADGTYTITANTGGLPIRAVAAAGTRAQRTHDGEDCYLPGSCAAQPAAGVAVADGGSVAIPFALNPGARLSGQVRAAPTNAPVASASLTLHAFDATGVSKGTFNIPAGEDGGFDFPQLRAGARYALVAREPNAVEHDFLGAIAPDTPCDGFSVSCWPDGPTARLFVAGDVVAYTVTLRRGGRIEWLLRSAGNGAPIYTEVEVQVAAATPVIGYSSQGPGRFLVGPVIPGNVRLRAGDVASADFVPEIHDELPCTPSSCAVSSGAPIALAEGDRLQLVETLVPKRSVRGRVVDTGGAPVAGITVQAGDTYADFFNHLSEVFNPRTADVTDANGAFELNGFWSGALFVRTVGAAGYVDAADDGIACAMANRFCQAWAGGYTIFPDGFTGDPDVGDLVLARAGAIAGVVLNPASQTPAVGSWVDILDAEGRFAHRARVGDDGSYRIDHLPPGSYRVLAEYFSDGGVLYPAVPCPYPPAFTFAQCDVDAGTPVTVVAGETTPSIDFGRDPGYVFGNGFE